MFLLGYKMPLCSNSREHNDMQKVCGDCGADLCKASYLIGDTTKIYGYRESLNLIIDKLKESNESPKSKKTRGKRL